MRAPGCTPWLYQLSPSTLSTQNTWIAPPSSFPPSARIIPASSYSKKRPLDVGKTRIGCPACPNTSDSMSRPNSWLYCLLYSRFMRARIVTEPHNFRHLPVLRGAAQPVVSVPRGQKEVKIKFRDAWWQSTAMNYRPGGFPRGLIPKCLSFDCSVVRFIP